MEELTTMNFFSLTLASIASFGAIVPLAGSNITLENVFEYSEKSLCPEYECLSPRLDRIEDHRDISEDKFLHYVNGHARCKKQFHKFSEALIGSYLSGEGFTEADVIEIFDALVYAAKKHKNGVRNKSYAPYIFHPVIVAKQLIVIGGVHEKDVIIAALLHDTVEKADVTFEQLELKFGPRITGFVREVTDDYSLPKSERRELQILNAPSKTAGAAQIDLSDKLYDIKELSQQELKSGDQKAICTVLWIQCVIDRLPWVNATLRNECQYEITNLLDQLFADNHLDNEKSFDNQYESEQSVDDQEEDDESFDDQQDEQSFDNYQDKQKSFY